MDEYKHLQVPRALIKIAAGERTRRKVIEVAGLAPATLRIRLRVDSE